MRRNVAVTIVSVLCFGSASAAMAQRAPILRGIKTVQVDPTVIGNPEKVKEDFAANLVEDSLRNALRSSNFEIGDAPIKAHIVLDEFSSGNTAKRLLVGLGAVCNTVEGRPGGMPGSPGDMFGNALAVLSLRGRG